MLDSNTRPARIAALASLLSALCLTTVAGAANCGGDVPCACGDRVVRDTVLTSDIGPCAWGSDPTELVGLRIDSGVTLDCAHHAIRGPDERRKEAFGVKFGVASRPVEGATLRNCDISGFWWGVHVTSSTDVLIEGNTIHHNGWMDPLANGTGYGINVTGIELADTERFVVVRDNWIHHNGDEGIHLSHSTGVELRGNRVEHNGKEQIYLLRAGRSAISGNDVAGGTLGLQLLESSANAFSYNRFRAPLHRLQNDSRGNAFVYDDFAGRLRIAPTATDNTFSFVRVDNAGAVCVDVAGQGTSFVRPWLGECGVPVNAAVSTSFSYAVGLAPGRVRSPLIGVRKGCNADQDGNGIVDAADAAVIASALGSSPGTGSWNPAADLDRNGTVDEHDQAVVGWQSGPCPELNARPKGFLKRTLAQDGPVGQPDVVRLDAGRSTDPDGRIVRFELSVLNRLTRTVVASLDLGPVPSQEVVLEQSFPPGRYTASLVVTDPYWERSRVVRRSFRVR